MEDSKLELQLRRDPGAIPTSPDDPGEAVLRRVALQNIGYNYIWIFVGWDVVEAISWYFFCVESQGRSLEELEWVYNQPNPVKASLHVDKVVVQVDGTVTEKIVDQSSN